MCTCWQIFCVKGKVITTHHNSERSTHHRSPIHRMPRLLFSPRIKTLADKIMTGTKKKRHIKLNLTTLCRTKMCATREVLLILAD